MWVVKTVAAIVIRPWLWKSASRFMPSRWWTFYPYLPIPSKEFLRWRMETVYGNLNARPTSQEIVRFLSWCRNFHKLVKWWT